MIKEEFKIFLTDTLGVKIETLKEALTSDSEVEVSYKSGMLLDDTQLTSLKSTVKKEGYNEGKVAGVEIRAKEIKEKFNIDIEGKDFDKIFTTYGENVLKDAKIEPDKKLREVNDSLANLQKKYGEDIGLKDQSIASLNTKLGDVKINADLQRLAPEGLNGINTNQFATLAKTEYSFQYEEGNLVAMKHGAILKDSLEKPLAIKDVLSDYGRTNGWIGEAGRGGGHQGGGSSSKFETINDVYKHMDVSNINPDSPEGEKLITDFKNSQK